MRVLLSTIGSRGDVQPLLALALELRQLGHEARMCVPPDFRELIEANGFHVTAIGPELRKLTGGNAPKLDVSTPEKRRALAEASVASQFEKVSEAARGCDVIVAATALQTAARSVAEILGIPYVFVAYCPAVLPSPHHAPLPLPGQPPADGAHNRELWARDTARFNETFGAPLNAQRAKLGLAPVADVRNHIFTDRPWLASDPTLGPWTDPSDDRVFQPGAWIVADERPLPKDVEQFLDRGEPPVYFGLGSMRASQELAAVVLQAARSVGRRVIVSRGWAELAPPDDRDDCLFVDEINQQALFKRVAAVVHHGGAGTTTAAAVAGAPQVVIPQMYDQRYWAGRVVALGIGATHPAGSSTVESLGEALSTALEPDVSARARSVATRVRRDGARVAALRLTEDFASRLKGVPDAR